ncbi:regulator of G-protein signaling [Acrasis kona]|uniref:Regulator of G-protein signaling n=1 Tax=Acrasis kona TaxID=1008807 RepID=A0AAW2ZIL9_9EUKA
MMNNQTVLELITSSNNTNGTTNTTSTSIQPLAIPTFVISIVLRASVILVCVVLMLLLFIKRKSQPVSSRLWVPYVFTISKLLNNIAYIQVNSPVQWSASNQQAGCYISLWATVPLYVISLLCVTLMFVRFFVLQWFTRRSEQTLNIYRDWMNNEDAVLKRSADGQKRVDKIIKFLMSPILHGFIIIASVLSLYIVGAVDLGRPRTSIVCSDEWSNFNLTYAAIMARYEVVVVVVICVFAVLLVLVDLLANDSLIPFLKRKISIFELINQLFVEGDPLRYRMELYCMSIPGGCLGLIFGIFGIVSVSTGGQPESANLIRTFLYVLFWEYPSMIVLPGIILYYSFKWDRRKSKNKLDPSNTPYASIDITKFDDTPDTIHRLLGCGDVVTHDLFKNFAKKEFSVENDDLKAHEALPADDYERKVKSWNFIYDSYLTSSSLNEVNVPKKFIDSAKKEVDGFLSKYNSKDSANNQGVSTPTSPPSPSLEVQSLAKSDSFEAADSFPAKSTKDIMSQIVLNLIDTYSRFYYSNEFQRFIKKNKF